MQRLLTLAVAAVLLAACESEAKTWYILPDGSGDTPSIQAGVNASELGDTLLLGPGVFRGAGNRDIEFLEQTDLHIRSLDGRERTIIDCESQASAFYINWFPGGQRRVHGKRWAPSLCLTGVTIRHAGAGTDRDAAFYWPDGWLELNDCVVEGSIGDVIGGGFYTNAYVRDSVVRDNEGAAYIGRGVLYLIDSQVLRNGKAICGSDLALIAENSLISDTRDAAVFVSAVSGVSLTNTTISRSRGSALIVDGGATIVGCTISDNRGGIRLESIGATIENTLFVGNGGGIEFVLDGKIMQSTLADNDIPTGALILAGSRSDVRISQSIVASNHAPTIYHCLEGQLTVDRTDIFANRGLFLVGQVDLTEVFSADPWFCNRFNDDYTLQAGSPCLPENSPTGTLVGALPQGCEPLIADLHLAPRALNVKSHDLLLVTFSVPGGSVDPSTVRLDGSLEPVSMVTQGGGRNKIRYRCEFDVRSLAALLPPGRAKTTVALTAQLEEGIPVRAIGELRLVGLPPAGVEIVESKTAPPIRPGIHSVTPNPFNPVTRIRYGVTQAGPARLVIYDVAGRVVARLIDENKPAGEYEVPWNADAVSSGVYFARLTTPEGAYTSKLIVVK